MDSKEKKSKEKPKSKDENKTEIKVLNESKEINLIRTAPRKRKIIKEIIDDSKFLEALQAREQQDFSPSLGQAEVAAPTARATDLEQQVGFNSNPMQDNKDNKDDPFKYNAGVSDGASPIYTSSKDESAKIFQAERTNPLDFRREKPFESSVREIERSSFFEQKQSSKGIETYVPAKRVDPLRASKEDVFGKQNIKYNPSD